MLTGARCLKPEGGGQNFGSRWSVVGNYIWNVPRQVALGRPLGLYMVPRFEGSVFRSLPSGFRRNAPYGKPGTGGFG